MGRATQQNQRGPIRDRTYVLTFGKYKGMEIDEVMELNPQYLVWLHNNNDFFELDHLLLDEAEENSKDWRP